MKRKPCIGVACLARNTYDVAAAKELFQQTKEELFQDERIVWIIEDRIVIETEDAIACSLRFLQKKLDALVLISGTFHLGNLALEFSRQIPDVPLLLWAYPELAYNGGKIRLNSLCGVNLDASNLYKAGRKNFHVCMQQHMDETFIKAVQLRHVLQDQHFAIAGHHAQGFYNIDVDELALYRKFHILIDHYELDEIFQTIHTKEKQAYYFQKLKQYFCCDDITETQLEKTAVLCAKIAVFMKDKRLGGLAIRCWPEFAASYGIAPCAAMSVLQGEGLLLGCEGDIDGLLSMAMHRALVSTPPFLADLSQMDRKENTLLLWHCGVAPVTLWDGVSIRSLDTYFAGGKGVTAGFVLRQGHVHLLRMDSVNGKYRIFMGKGTVMPMEKQLCGTYAKCLLKQSVDDVFQLIVQNGAAHHFSVTYGDVEEAIHLFAKMYELDIFAFS